MQCLICSFLAVGNNIKPLTLRYAYLHFTGYCCVIVKAKECKSESKKMQFEPTNEIMLISKRYFIGKELLAFVDSCCNI